MCWLNLRVENFTLKIWIYLGKSILHNLGSKLGDGKFFATCLLKWEQNVAKIEINLMNIMEYPKTLVSCCLVFSFYKTLKEILKMTQNDLKMTNLWKYYCNILLLYKL
jgi:hypothetical protein